MSVFHARQCGFLSPKHLQYINLLLLNLNTASVDVRSLTKNSNQLF